MIRQEMYPSQDSFREGFDAFCEKARGSTCFVFWNSEKNSVLGHVLAAQRDNWVKNVLQPTMIN